MPLPLFGLWVEPMPFRTIDGGEPVRLTMKGRVACLLILNLLCMTMTIAPLASAETGNSGWRTVGIDPNMWTDGPEPEDTPMKDTYQGNAIVEIEVSYVPAHFNSRAYGVVVIELFEQWAPITTENMITNVEDGIYNGIFFHRVIDDFVVQGGDPTCSKVGAYPFTSPQCGSGGTGETIPLEIDPNLSHVDGAIGMARSQDPDSADAQWYIAETEAHNLDPENRDDEGYATFGIVRNGQRLNFHELLIVMGTIRTFGTFSIMVFIPVVLNFLGTPFLDRVPSGKISVDQLFFASRAACRSISLTACIGFLRSINAEPPLRRL